MERPRAARSDTGAPQFVVINQDHAEMGVLWRRAMSRSLPDFQWAGRTLVKKSPKPSAYVHKTNLQDAKFLRNTRTWLFFWKVRQAPGAAKAGQLLTHPYQHHRSNDAYQRLTGQYPCQSA
jgi:hypothetical protein